MDSPGNKYHLMSAFSQTATLFAGIKSRNLNPFSRHSSSLLCHPVFHLCFLFQLSSGSKIKCFLVLTISLSLFNFFDIFLHCYFYFIFFLSLMYVTFFPNPQNSATKTLVYKLTDFILRKNLSVHLFIKENMTINTITNIKRINTITNIKLYLLIFL